MKQEPLAALQAFRLVAEQGSFTRAAARQGVSTSALSQTIRQLEDSLGVRLLSRSTRRVGLTEAGQSLLERVAPALSSVCAALEETRQYRDAPGGTLRLTVPRSAATLLLQPHLAAFMQAYPDVQVDIDIDDGFVDLIGGHFDAGIRLGEAVQRDMVAIALGGPLRVAVVASPAYLARCGTPRHPQELAQHRCLCQRFTRGGAVYHWEFAQGTQRFELAPGATLIVNDKALRIRAAQDGAGVAYVFEQDVRDDLRSGRLVAMLEEWVPEWSAFFLYFPSRAHMAPKLRAFIDFFRQRLSHAE